MNRLPAIFGAIGMVAVLTAICALSQRSVIEGDLHLRAMAALRGRGLEDLSVTLEGRDLRLSGVLLAEADRERALDAAAVFGIRTVEDRLRIVESGDLWLRLRVSEEGDVTIRGWVDDRPEMEAFRRAVECWFRSASIDDDSSLTSTLVGSSPLDAAWAVLPWLSELEPGLLEITSERLLLAGRTPRRDVVELVGDAMAWIFEGQTEVEVEQDFETAEMETGREGVAATPEIESAESVAEEVSWLDSEGCQVRLNALLASEDLPFEKWSPRLDSSSAALLGRIATLLDRCQKSSVRITGLADRKSRESVDRILGNERARSVRAWLAALGVDPNRMTIDSADRGAKRVGSHVVGAIEVEVGGIEP